MVEAKRSASNSSFSTTMSRSMRVVQPHIIVQNVALDTPVPPLPKPEELLPQPDLHESEMDIRKINSTLRRFRRRLKEYEDAGQAGISPEELEGKLQAAKARHAELHKQRDVLEQRDKQLAKEIKKDPNFPIIAKSKKKMSLYQTIQRKEKINSIINVATIKAEDEAKLIRELEDLAKILPVLTKINEQEKGENGIKNLWKLIQEVKCEIESIEKSIRDFYDKTSNGGKGTAEPRLDKKQVVTLKEQIESLYQEKREVRAQLMEAQQAYAEQQTQILTAKWVAKRKQELINLRTREAKEKKQRAGKCVDLIETCGKIMAKYKGDPSVSQEENPQTTKDAVTMIGKKDNKKKKKKRQKKAETLITALELDTLRPQFESFEVAIPKGKEELRQAVKSLYQKLAEIEAKPLTEVLTAYCSYKGEDSEDKSGGNHSFTDSFSGSVVEDLNLLENIGEQTDV